MALQVLEFSFQATGDIIPLPKEWSHTGVVGSGDLEILMEYKELKGKTEVKITTPVTGFDAIWKAVIGKFVEDTKLGDAVIEINDNNATPFIVSMRLKQALIEARGGDL